MRIISFYTDGEYEKCIHRLQKSASKFGYKVSVAKFSSLETWNMAIKGKVGFIQEQYERYGGPLLYLDADTEIKSKLETLEQFIVKHDISARERNLENRFNCGVMGFGTNKKKIIPFLKDWVRLTNKTGHKYKTVDQIPFEQTLDKHKNIVIGNLPYQYNFLDHDMLHNHTISDAVIYHYKISKSNDKARKWKKYYKSLS